MRIIVLSFCMLFGLTSLGQIHEQEIELYTSNDTLHGSKMKPYPVGKPDVVLMISGSGPTDRDGNNTRMKNNSLKMLAEGLAEQGYATIRFDKRGVAKSASSLKDEHSLRFETYVNDVVSWIDSIRNSEEFSKIFVLGHSEGSLIGMLASQQSKVDGYISVAGPGFPAGQVIREQLAAQPQDVIDASSKILDKLENGKTTDSIPPLLFALFRPSIQPYLISWFKYDPSVEIGKLKCPTLIIQGTTDIQVKEEDAQALKMGTSNGRLVLFKNMNHVLKTAPSDRMENIKTYSNPTLPLHKGLVKSISKYLKKNS